MDKIRKSERPKIPEKISEKRKKEIRQGKGQPRVERKSVISVKEKKLEERPVEVSKILVPPTQELREALVQAVELIKKNHPFFVIDFDNTLQALANRSPEDQEKFIQALKEKFAYQEGLVSWVFKGLQSRVASWYSTGTEELSKTYDYVSTLGEFAANMLTQARKEAVNYVSESVPSLPLAADEIVQSMGQKMKDAITYVISTPTFEQIMYLMLLPTYPLEESDEDIQKDAQEKIEDIEIFIEKMSNEVGEFYSLEEGKLEILTDKMSEKFNETVIQSISTTAFAISEFIISTVSDVTQKMLSREGMTNLLIKITMCSILMDAFGPKEVLAGVHGREHIAFGLPNNVEHLPGVVGKPYIDPGLLTPVQIKILVFCIMTIMKGRRPLVYPTSVFFLLKGPLAFVSKGGKGYIKALIDMLTESQSVSAASAKFLVGKLIEILVFKSVMKKTFENTLRQFCETLGLHDVELFSKQGPSVEEIFNKLNEFSKGLKADPEEVEKLIEEINELSSKEKDNLLIRFSAEQMEKLPEGIQSVLFDLGTVLIHMPSKELRKFFDKDLDDLSDVERESLFSDLSNFSSEKKQQLRERLYPIFNQLPFEARKQLYDTLEFNLAEVLIHAELPNTWKTTVGRFLEEKFKNEDEQEVFEQEIKKLSLEETEKLIQKFSKIRGLSAGSQSKLRQVLARHLSEEKAKN